MSDSEDDQNISGEESGAEDDVDVEESEEEEEEDSAPRRKRSRVEGFILDEAGQ